VFLVLSVALTLAALLAVVRGSGLLRRVVVPLCALLLAGAAFRGWTLAPLLACGDHTAVARQSDGSYACYDR
jgi:hypothetical protein